MPVPASPSVHPIHPRAADPIRRNADVEGRKGADRRGELRLAQDVLDAPNACSLTRDQVGLITAALGLESARRSTYAAQLLDKAGALRDAEGESYATRDLVRRANFERSLAERQDSLRKLLGVASTVSAELDYQEDVADELDEQLSPEEVCREAVSTLTGRYKMQDLDFLLRSAMGAITRAGFHGDMVTSALVIDQQISEAINPQSGPSRAPTLIEACRFIVARLTDEIEDADTVRWICEMALAAKGPESDDQDEDDPTDMGEARRQTDERTVGIGVRCSACGRTVIGYVVPETGHRIGQHLCDHCYRKHAAPCEKARRGGGQ